MSQEPTLWAHCRLPTWDADRMFALFCRHREGEPPTPAEQSEYALLLMCLIKIHFANRRWYESLPMEGLDLQDVAQTLLLHLCRKTTAFGFDQYKTGKKYLVLLSQMYLAMDRVVFDLIAGARRDRHVVSATDAIRRRDRNGEASGSLDESGLDSGSASAPSPVIRSLRPLFRAARDRVCSGIHGDITVIVMLYRHQKNAVLSEGALCGYAELPEKLLSRASPEQHLLISSRIVRMLGAVAGELATLQQQ